MDYFTYKNKRIFVIGLAIFIAFFALHQAQTKPFRVEAQQEGEQGAIADPDPSCVPPPVCLYSNPRCLMPINVNNNYCPFPTPTPSCVVPPACARENPPCSWVTEGTVICKEGSFKCGRFTCYKGEECYYPSKEVGINSNESGAPIGGEPVCRPVIKPTPGEYCGTKDPCKPGYECYQPPMMRECATGVGCNDVWQEPSCKPITKPTPVVCGDKKCDPGYDCYQPPQKECPKGMECATVLPQPECVIYCGKEMCKPGYECYEPRTIQQPPCKVVDGRKICAVYDQALPSCRLKITPTPPACTRRFQGDSNCDDRIDDRDYDIWSYNYAGIDKACAYCSADFNKDKTINLIDFEIWRGNRFSVTNILPTSDPELDDEIIPMSNISSTGSGSAGGADTSTTR